MCTPDEISSKPNYFINLKNCTSLETYGECSMQINSKLADKEGFLIPASGKKELYKSVNTSNELM